MKDSEKVKLLSERFADRLNKYLDNTPKVECPVCGESVEADILCASKDVVVIEYDCGHLMKCVDGVTTYE